MTGSRLRATLLLATLAGGWVPALWLAAPAASATATDLRTLDDALTAVLAWVLLVGGAWWSVAVALVAIELALTGRATHTAPWAPRAAKVVVAALCGAGALTVIAAPATADPAGGSAPELHLLDGLALPDRVADRLPDRGHGPARTSPSPTAEATVTVRPGDTLWGLAHDLDLEWPSLYAANRGVVGPDPDLIQPGQRLVVPSHTTHEGVHR